MTAGLATLFIIGGFALLIVGGEFLVSASVDVATRAKLRPAVIALTIIAFGTSAPELVTSALAAYRNTADVAIGNIVGSNIFNILAVLGLVGLLKPFRVDSRILKWDFPFLLFFSSLVFVTGYKGYFGFVDGILFLILLAGFVTLSLKKARNHQQENDQTKKGPLHNIVFLTLGIAGLAYGAHLALEGVVYIGLQFGLSDRFIGLTIISMGTGLPELATSLVAALKGEDDISVNNIIGSNIMNILAILGVTCLFLEIPANQEIIYGDVFIMIVSTILLGIFMGTNKGYFGRLKGATFVILYLLYLSYLTWEI